MVLYFRADLLRRLAFNFHLNVCQLIDALAAAKKGFPLLRVCCQGAMLGALASSTRKFEEES